MSFGETQRCASCGADVTGSPARCPSCGCLMEPGVEGVLAQCSPPAIRSVSFPRTVSGWVILILELDFFFCLLRACKKENDKEIIPSNVSRWAIAASYLGLVSCLPFVGLVGAPLAMWAALRTFHDLRQKPHLAGRPRAIFGFMCALIGCFVQLAYVGMAFRTMGLIPAPHH